jgi:hypothetical protein
MKKSFSIMLLLTIVIFSYGQFISVSDKREYGEVSLDHYLLTPEYLSNIARLCKNSPRFEYGSADGPKPAIIHLSCSFNVSELVNYLEAQDYKQIGISNYKKGDFEIGFEVDDENGISNITGYEYL